MSGISLAQVTRSDGPALIQAHVDSRAHHQPWVQTFTDEAGFEEWFARLAPGKMASFVARHDDGGIVSLCTLSEIVMGAFQSAYLGFHGMWRLMRGRAS